MRAEATSVKVGEVAVRLHRAGKGRKVIFLHGAGGHLQWFPFYDALAEDYELILPEHPGFGASDDPPFIRNVPDLAMFYLDLFEAMGLDDFHLVGHSLGGWLAAEILIRDRARCNSLTLIAAAGIRVKGVPSGDLFIWAPEETQRNLYHDQSFAERVLAIVPSEEQMEVMVKNRYTSAKLGWQPRWFNPDLAKWLHRIKLPALVIWGDDDKVMPPAYAAAWGEHLTDARIVILERCGHIPHVEQAERVSRLVRDFLAGAAR